jgi:hypothetical protein
MSVAANMTGEMEPRQRAVTFLEGMAGAMGLLVLGFPLTPATIRASLLGWILVVVSIIRFRSGRSQIAQILTSQLFHKENIRG